MFSGSFTVAAGQVTFNMYADDGWILSVGANAGGQHPAYVSGDTQNAPASGPFSGYPVVGAHNGLGSDSQNNLVVNFPATGPTRSSWTTSKSLPVRFRLPSAPTAGRSHQRTVWAR